MCSPSPHLHYQGLIPPPDPFLHNNFATSLTLSPPIPNHTNLTHHSHYHQPTSHLEFLLLITHPPDLFLNNNSTSTPLFFKPTEKGEERTVNGSIFSNLENDFAITTELSVLEIDGREESRQDSPAITQSFPQYILPSGDSDSIVSLSAISVCNLDLGFSGSKPCFDFIFLPSNPIRSSCFELETATWATTVSSPAKTKGNTISTMPPEHSILVFDPGRSNVLNAKKKLERTVTIFVFETEKMPVNTISAPPPQSSIFVFDLGRILTTDHKSDVRHRLCIRMFQKALSSRDVSFLTSVPLSLILGSSPQGHVLGFCRASRRTEEAMSRHSASATRLSAHWVTFFMDLAHFQ